MDAGEGTAAGTEDPGAGQGPEGSEAGPSEARSEGKQERVRSSKEGGALRCHRRSQLAKQEAPEPKSS
jgi:hypothetical protein